MAKQILVIDDDLAVRDAFLLALEETGFHVRTADSGGSGLRCIAEAHFDLIFIDLKMPGMDGIETLRQIRQRENGKAAPLVYIITAFYKEFLSGLKQLDAENIDYELLKKPMSGQQIKSITEQILQDN